MATADFEIETPATPEQIRTAMLDFTSRRPDLWPGLAAKYYEVRSVEGTTAVIREGSGFPANVWAVELYEFDKPDVVKWTVQESNFCAPGKGVEMQVRPGPGGGSIVRVRWERIPTSFKGRMVIPMIARNNAKMLQKIIKKALDQLPEALEKHPAPR